jgi:hypothetical protein
MRSVGAELFHGVEQTDKWTRQTDITKLTVAFQNFANAPKKGVDNNFEQACAAEGLKFGILQALAEIF